MNGWEERRLVYAALIIACSVVGIAAGPIAGLFSFIQVTAIMELTNWIGRAHRSNSQRRS